MDNQFECKNCPGQRASTAPRQGEAKNGSRFKLKKVKVVLRDIHEPRTLLPKERLESLCESCRPRRKSYPSVLEHASRFKRGCKRKSCEELLKSWKAPTRRHRLPRHLHDFVLDSTVLHLIEFSSWYNRGQIARRYEPAEEFLAEQRSVISMTSRPDIGKMKRKRADKKEHELNKLEKERIRKRCQPTLSGPGCVSKATKQKPQCQDKTKTVLAEPKHRGRPKTCNNASKIRSASSSSVQHRGRPPKKCKESSQTMLATSSRVAKNKPRVKASKCEDKPQNKCKVVSSSALTEPKHRGRPKRFKKASKNTLPSVTTVVAFKHKSRPKKCKTASENTPPSVPTVVVPKHRGRPKICKTASENTPSSVTTVVVSKHRGQPKKCKNESENTPPSVTTVVVLKHQGRPKKEKNAPRTRSTSLRSRSAACKHPSRTKKCEATLKITSQVPGSCKQSSGPAKMKKRHSEKKRVVHPCSKDEIQRYVTQTECSPQQSILEKLTSTVDYHVQRGKLDSPSSQNHNSSKQLSRAKKKGLSAVDTKGSARPKKRKCGILISNEDGQNTLEDEEACTRRLPTLINPDFSIADTDADMNIDEYLVQLGTYLEHTDNCESTAVGVINEVQERLFDENNNLVTDSETLQKRDAGAVQSCGGIIDVGTKNTVGKDSRDEIRDANNNHICAADTVQVPDPGRRRSDSGISDVSYDVAPISQSKRTRRPQKRREQVSSGRLNLRRSERLRFKEDYRRCNALWTDKGNQSGTGSGSRGNITGGGSRCGHECLEKSQDDDLLQEFVAMCPLDGDLPFSDEDCLSLLAESPIFSGNEWSTSCLARPNDQGLGSQAVDAISSICPRNPPKVRRNLWEFLLDEHSIHLLVSRPVRSPPRHGQDLGQDTAQEDAGFSPGDLQISPGFGPLTDSQVALLKRLGLDGTQEEPADDLMEEVSRSDRTAPIVTQPPVQSSQESNFSNQGLDGEILQEMEEQIKDQNGGGDACGTLKLPHQKGPLVVIPCLHSETTTIAAAEVWLPSGVVVSSADNVFFLPVGEWSVKDRAWHVPKVLWRNTVDGGWHVSEIQEDVVIGTCFVPEEAWLVSQGARGKTSCRVYDIRPMSKAPNACQDPRVPVTACHSSIYVSPLKPERRKPKKWQCVPIPGIPPPFDMPSCLQPSMPVHPTNPYPLILPVPMRFSSTQHIVYSNGLDESRPGLPIPAFDQQQQQPRLLETSAASQNVRQPPSSYVENRFCRTQQVTSGHLIGLDGYLSMTHNHSYGTSPDVMDVERTPLLTKENGVIRNDDGISNNHRNDLHGILSTNHRDTAVQEKEQPFNTTIDINNNDTRDNGVPQGDPSPVMITDINNNIVSVATDNDDLDERGLSEVAEIGHKVPSSVQEAVDQIHTCKEVTDLGQLLLEWCKSDVSFRRHSQVLAGIAYRLEKGLGNQSSQNFCVFAASFHAISQKDDYIPDYEDKCVLVLLGLSAVSKCLDQDQQEQAQNQVRSQPLQVQVPQAQCQPMKVQDLQMPTQVQSKQGPSHAMQLQPQNQAIQVQPQQVHNPLMQSQDRQRPVQAQLELVQNQVIQVQPQQVQNPLMQVQDQQRLAETQSNPDQDQSLHFQIQNQVQNQTVQVQTQPREDAYCILQMLLHLKLPLTEVLASMSLRSFQDPSQGLPEAIDSSAIRDVLGVLADFDPAMAFSVIQGLGWGHTVLEVSQEKEGFSHQLVALAEALLDCKKFWYCRVILSHLSGYECCRQPCRHLYSSLLGKLLDTQTDHESAMIVFEDMMESYLIVPGPVLSKLLTLMWKRTDDEGMEDALCVFHYGLGLGIYPMYRKMEDGVWEATVFVGATDAEVFFSLKTLLEEVHHQQDGVFEGGSGGMGGAAQRVPDVDKMLPGQKSPRITGSGRYGAKRKTVWEGTAFKKKGRIMALPGKDVQVGKQPPGKTSEATKRTRVSIRLLEPQQVNQGNLPIPDDVASNDGFSRMLSMKHTIQDVLEHYFHPLTIKPSAEDWCSHRKKVSRTLIIDEDALKDWLIAQGRKKRSYMVID